MLVKKHVLGLQVAVSYAMLVAVFDRACTEHAMCRGVFHRE
jgi:hypothetical protein